MHRGVYPTDAGMHCLWDQATFAKVRDYDSWASELLDDANIERHIRAGAFVPLNIGSDGAMEIEVRVGTAQAPAALSARESQYLIVRSEPYLLRTQGAVGISGIEHVAIPVADGAGDMAVPPGDYAVRVHLIAWDEEPGMQTDQGPAAGALPDYVVLIDPVSNGTSFRSAVSTFPTPG